MSETESERRERQDVGRKYAQLVKLILDKWPQDREELPSYHRDPIIKAGSLCSDQCYSDQC